MRILRKLAAVIAAILATFSGAWAGARLMLDMIGRALAAEDFANPEGVVARGLLWLFSTPWWVPGLIAAMLSLALIALMFSGRSETAPGEATAAKSTAMPSPSGPLVHGWNAPLTPVIRQNYKNETVSLDGRHFIDCTFENVTFLYQGTGPTQMSNCKKIPESGFMVSVQSDNPAITTALSIMASLGVVSPITTELYKTDSR